MADVCLLCIILSVLIFTEWRLFTVCSSAVLHTAVSNAFFWRGRLIIRNRPSGGSPDPSICSTRGTQRLPLGGGGGCCMGDLNFMFYSLLRSKSFKIYGAVTFCFNILAESTNSHSNIFVFILCHRKAFQLNLYLLATSFWGYQITKCPLPSPSTTISALVYIIV